MSEDRVRSPGVELFEKWARPKGFNLERKPEVQDDPKLVVYQDPTTQAAWEGYCAGGYHGHLYWYPRYQTEAKIRRDLMAELSKRK